MLTIMRAGLILGMAMALLAQNSSPATAARPIISLGDDDDDGANLGSVLWSIWGTATPALWPACLGSGPGLGPWSHPAPCLFAAADWGTAPARPWWEVTDWGGRLDSAPLHGATVGDDDDDDFHVVPYLGRAPSGRTLGVLVFQVGDDEDDGINARP